jgi:hypothetical protein
MPTIFTQHVRNLRPTDESPELFKVVAEALCIEMVKQGLWELSPEVLGYDWNNWHENTVDKDKAETGNVRQPASCLDKHRIKIVAAPNKTLAESLKKCPDAFKDLLFDCYINVITQQLEFLKDNITLGNDIDGLVRQNIHFFVTNLRRKTDPVGYAVAQNAKDAIQRAMARGVITSNQLKINNNTQLTFFSSGSTTLSEKDAISEALHHNSAWTKDIQLKLSSQKNKEQVRERFCECVCQLRNSDIGCFRFKRLVDAMKEDVRALIQALEAQKRPPEVLDSTTIEEGDDDETDDGGEIVLFIKDDAYDYLLLSEWCEHIHNAIAQSDYQDRVRQQLHKVFTEIEVPLKQRKKYPLPAEIAEILGLAPATLNGYIKKLRLLVEQLKSNDFE